jgi:signal transduction histidine kinase
VRGTGLGLHICRKIVEAHGGQIFAESKPGEGACFTFTLPYHFVPQTQETSEGSAHG